VGEWKDKMLVQTYVVGSLAATALIVYLFPKGAPWDLVAVAVTSIWPSISPTGHLEINVVATAKILISNQNYVGSHLYRARLDVYAHVDTPWDPNIVSFAPRIGYIDVGEHDISGLKGRTSPPSVVTADVTIDRISLYVAYCLLSTLWNSSGLLSVTALGSALVQADLVNPYLDPLLLISMRCPEELVIHMNLFSNLATLKNSPSQRCQMNYNMGRSLSDSLPIISPRFVFESL
jgi:hypothetical protein